MAKVVFLAALLAALVAVSAAQLSESEMRFRDRQCMREVQDSPLDACRQVLDRQVTRRGGAPPQVRPPGAAARGVRMRCCQQLQDVSRECRCAAVRRMVRDYEESMPMPLEQGQIRYYGGEGSSSEPGYYGEGSSSSEQGYYGEGSSSSEQGYYGEQQPQMTRVRLTRAKQYAAQLPSMCRVEPQQCSIFAAGQY
uniref:Bifunctional inhibitor/plant lipid transfer protein/seed storage helical domain-containing protein n=1 Tax=Oryza brachyantha TaxID=4533 RepID=J3M8K1_ORYBR